MNFELNNITNHKYTSGLLKFILLVLLLSIAIISKAQSTLTVSGQVLFPNGSPAVEAGVVLVFEKSSDYSDFTVTNSDGEYAFTINLPVGFMEECFDVALLDCNGFYIPESGCYSSKNSDFEFNYTFCESGSSICNSFIVSEPFDSENIELSVIQSGIGPYTYLWNDGNTDSTRVLPISTEGSYCVTVTAFDACESEACITLTPVVPCFVIIEESNGYQTTILTAQGFGSSEDLDYIWSNGVSENVIQITESGEYCVTVSDDSGCTASECLTVTVDNSDWYECFAEIDQQTSGKEDQLIATPFGIGPFSYVWTLDGMDIGDDYFITVIGDGEYCVRITDDTECTFETCYTYSFVSDCMVSFSYSLMNGEPQINAVTEGFSPYSYHWSTTEVTESILISSSDTYCLTIVDDTGCESSFCDFVDIDLFEVCDTEINSEILAEGNLALLSVSHLGIVDASSYSYQWSTEETADSIVITEDGYYCLTVTDNQGCVYETCTYFTFDQDLIPLGLAVSYVNSDTQLGESATVEIYKVDYGYFYLYDELPLFDEFGVDGLYHTLSIEDGTYLARARPDDSEVYIPSYRNSTPYWEESPTITIANGGEGLKNVININAIPMTAVTGVGAIGGQIFSYGENENIMLFKDSEPVRQAYIGFGGGFFFDNLAYGTYIVTWERPGFERLEREVTLSPSNPEELFIDFGYTTSTEDEVYKPFIYLFPNPTFNTITFSSNLLEENFNSISIVDVTGREIENVVITKDPDSKSALIDVSDFQSGVYFVSMINNGRINTRKFIKL